MNNMKNCNEKGVEPLDYKLLQGRTVLVFGALTDEVVHKTVSSLLYLQEQDPCTPVKMYINSEGGNETEGLAIFDVMRNLSCPVHTICVGKAHGAAALLLAGGEKGNRSAYANSEIMLNQIERDRTFGQASDIELETEHLMAGKKRMNSLFAALCDRSDDEIALNMERKYWLFADRAKEYGLIDQVIG